MTLTDTLTSTAVGTLNLGGGLLRRAGITRPDLRLVALLDAARQRAGLDDFGDWPIDNLLPRLLDSYECEARLSTLGRIAVRELIVSLLENLLYLEQDRSASPKIARQIIEAPVFIIGLPRTGTTFLHGVIAQDAATRVPLTWEVMFPAGYSESAVGIGRARRRTASRLAWANRLAPEFKRIHEISADLPQECIAIMAQGFASIQFHTTHDVPSYQDWFEKDGQELGYEAHYRFLQHLQARRGGRRWALKAPGHLFGLNALIRRYPDARIIQTHRDPLKAMGSIASHANVLRRAFSDDTDPQLIASDWCGRWADALDRSLNVRESWQDGRVYDVSYTDLVTSPLKTVESIYEFLGWPMTNTAREAMHSFVTANPKNKHGRHRYSLADYGLSHAALSERFLRYCEQFNIRIDAE
jgi:hypothetical protein